MRRCPLREFPFGMLLAIALAACAAHPAAAPAARVATPGAVTGRLEGAAYRIEVCDMLRLLEHEGAAQRQLGHLVRAARPAPIVGDAERTLRVASRFRKPGTAT